MTRTPTMLFLALLCESALVQQGCAKCKDPCSTQDQASVSQATPEDLRKAYEETCRSYHAIDEFRANLLPLLPFASGVGWLFLLAKKDTVTDYLKPIALFGALVTAGLFIYEARGAQRCEAIKCVARNLERKMGLTVNTGQFLGQPDPYGLVIREITAGIVVYGSVLVGWLWILKSDARRRRSDSGQAPGGS